MLKRNHFRQLENFSGWRKADRLRFCLVMYCVSYAIPAISTENDSSSQFRHIQILAASCAACHGTDGNSVGGTPVLAGLDKAKFVSRMQEFRTTQPASTVMAQHAKGLRLDEIEQLAIYFYQQPRLQSAVLKPAP